MDESLLKYLGLFKNSIFFIKILDLDKFSLSVDAIT